MIVPFMSLVPVMIVVVVVLVVVTFVLVASQAGEAVVVESGWIMVAREGARIARRSRKWEAAAGRVTNRRGTTRRRSRTARATAGRRDILGTRVADAANGRMHFLGERNQRPLQINFLGDDDVHVANHALAQTLLDRARAAVAPHPAAAEMQRQAA